MASLPQQCDELSMTPQGTLSEVVLGPLTHPSSGAAIVPESVAQGEVGRLGPGGGTRGSTGGSGAGPKDVPGRFPTYPAKAMAGVGSLTAGPRGGLGGGWECTWAELL